MKDERELDDDDDETGITDCEREVLANMLPLEESDLTKESADLAKDSVPEIYQEDGEKKAVSDEQIAENKDIKLEEIVLIEDHVKTSEVIDEAQNAQ
jgi:hypothetical protein